MKIGLIIIDEDPGVALRVAKAADAAGVHSIWSIDYYNRSSLARVAAFAAATEHALIGTSVIPLFARSPLALAAAAVDIQRLSGGRFVLGVGSSTRRMNHDWYGVEIDHPAPRAEERIQLLRRLMTHRHGRFYFSGRFDAVTMSHLERDADGMTTPILAAGVGPRMTEVAGRAADGFVGHTVASAKNLSDLAKPIIARTLARTNRPAEEFIFSSQVIASVGEDVDRARERAALQVGFYSTPKGYDALFPDEQDERSRRRAREAFAAGDFAGVGRAGLGLVDERAVFGTAQDVIAQLSRYEQTLDLALLYPPYFGVDPSEVTRNEYALIDVATQVSAD